MVKLLRATSPGAEECIGHASGYGFLTNAVDQLASFIVMYTAHASNTSLQGRR